MSVRVARLTPAGAAAIAVIGVWGSDAWKLLEPFVQDRDGRTLARPQPGRLRFCRFGPAPGDEVVLAARSNYFEIQCHGGLQVVDWMLELLVGAGAELTESAGIMAESNPLRARALELATRAPTLRTSGVLLDQSHGAFERAVESAIRQLSQDPPEGDELRRLARRAPLGRHLVEPWRVAVCGAPNVGKSSLINAMAGYQRAIVTAMPGTTRDVATTFVAFDGWPILLVDTAGIRDSSDDLEAEGIRRGKSAAEAADLIVWVTDVTAPAMPPIFRDRFVVAANKADLAPPPAALAADLAVSALSGAGVSKLMTLIVDRLVPEAPAPGEPVPFAPELADAVEYAAEKLKLGDSMAARSRLASLLRSAETQ